MSFGYLAGVTTAGAADEIVDWFATFQAWATGTLGWVVDSGGGTTNLVLRSISEAGGLTMLYLRIWRVGAGDTVRMEVRDDGAGTHETNEGGILDSGGAQFAYWMAGDMDAISISFKEGANYRTIYAGLVLPFALTVPDETYRMISTSSLVTCSVLRDSGGVWDVDMVIEDNAVLDGCIIDPFDGSLPLGGRYVGSGTIIAGQLKHVSTIIFEPAVNVMDTLTTGRGGATTTWIVLADGGLRFALRTGGVLPTGQADPASFTASTGIVAGYAALWGIISAHMTALGWTDLGDPGFWTSGRLYYSAGVSGAEEIYVGVSYAAPSRFRIYVQQDAGGTNHFPTNRWFLLEPAEFPLNYWIGGDEDCLYLVFQAVAGYELAWAGLVPAFAPGLLPPYAGAPLSAYQLCGYTQGNGVGAADNGGMCLNHAGVALQDIYIAVEGGGSPNSNPNAYDGTSYLLWPYLAHYNPAADPVIIGQPRYTMYSSGGGIANLDTITIGGQVYTVFFDHTGTVFCVRTT